MSANEATRLTRLPRGQHTVSKVILKQFARASSKPAERVISVFDRDNNVVFDAAPSRPFKIDYFDAHDPVAIEARWQQLETRFPAALRAVERGTIFGHPDLVEILYDVLSLHYIRSPAIKQVSSNLVDTVLDRSVESVGRRPDLLRRSFERSTGLVAAGPEALHAENLRLHAALTTPGHRAALFHDTLVSRFPQARAMFREHEIQICRVDPNCGLDLIIGDAPVILESADGKAFGPHQGVAVGDASDIYMPLSPTVAISLGASREDDVIGENEVRRLNTSQRKSFIRWLGALPGGASDLEMRDHLPPTVRRVPRKVGPNQVACPSR